MTGIQKKLGARIKELRKSKNYTQEQLAELLNLGVRSLGKIETGNSFPSTETLEKIISVFNLTADEIFNFEHLQPPQDLKTITLNMIDLHPEKITDIYKVVKALTS